MIFFIYNCLIENKKMQIVQKESRSNLSDHKKRLKEYEKIFNGLSDGRYIESHHLNKSNIVRYPTEDSKFLLTTKLLEEFKGEKLPYPPKNKFVWKWTESEQGIYIALFPELSMTEKVYFNFDDESYKMLDDMFMELLDDISKYNIKNIILQLLDSYLFYEKGKLHNAYWLKKRLLFLFMKEIENIFSNVVINFFPLSGEFYNPNIHLSKRGDNLIDQKHIEFKNFMLRQKIKFKQLWFHTLTEIKDRLWIYSPLYKNEMKSDLSWLINEFESMQFYDYEDLKEYDVNPFPNETMLCDYLCYPFIKKDNYHRGMFIYCLKIEDNFSPNFLNFNKSNRIIFINHSIHHVSYNNTMGKEFKKIMSMDVDLYEKFTKFLISDKFNTWHAWDVNFPRNSKEMTAEFLRFVEDVKKTQKQDKFIYRPYYVEKKQYRKLIFSFFNFGAKDDETTKLLDACRNIVENAKYDLLFLYRLNENVEINDNYDSDARDKLEKFYKKSFLFHNEIFNCRPVFYVYRNLMASFRKFKNKKEYMNMYGLESLSFEQENTVNYLYCLKKIDCLLKFFLSTLEIIHLYHQRFFLDNPITIENLEKFQMMYKHLKTIVSIEEIEAMLLEIKHVTDYFKHCFENKIITEDSIKLYDKGEFRYVVLLHLLFYTYNTIDHWEELLHNWMNIKIMRILKFFKKMTISTLLQKFIQQNDLFKNFKSEIYYNENYKSEIMFKFDKFLDYLKNPESSTILNIKQNIMKQNHTEIDPHERMFNLLKIVNESKNNQKIESDTVDYMIDIMKTQKIESKISPENNLMMKVKKEETVNHYHELFDKKNIMYKNETEFFKTIDINSLKPLKLKEFLHKE